MEVTRPLKWGIKKVIPVLEEIKKWHTISIGMTRVPLDLPTIIPTWQKYQRISERTIANAANTIYRQKQKKQRTPFHIN